MNGSAAGTTRVVQAARCRDRWPAVPAALLFLFASLPLGANDDPEEAFPPFDMTVEVLDDGTGRPVSGAEVIFDGNVDRTGPDGRVALPVRPTSQRPLNVDAPDHYVERVYLSGERIGEIRNAGNSLTIRLKRLETLVMVLRLTDRETGKTLDDAEDAQLKLFGKEHAFTKGRLRLELDYLKEKTRRALSGNTDFHVEAKGYEPLELEFPLDEVAESQRRYSRNLKVNVPLKRLPDPGKSVRLNIHLEDPAGAPVTGATASVRIDGFGHQRTASGKAVFRFTREALARFRDNFRDRLDVRVQAGGYQGPVTRNLPVSDLLNALDRDQDELNLVVPLRPLAPAVPGLAISVTPDRARIAAGESVTLEYRVENNGNVDLANVDLSDPSCSPARYRSGDTDGDSELDAGETWILECRASPRSDLSGPVRVQGTAPDGSVVRASAPVAVAVSACPAPEVEMPDVQGVEQIMAEEALRRSGFERVVSSTVETDQEPPGRVVDQTPGAGQCKDPRVTVFLVIATPLHAQPEHDEPLSAELECADGLEVAAGARPSRTCGVIVRGWDYSDDRVLVSVTNPDPVNLDVWPMDDAAWPPNMANPGVADMRFKERYIFTLFFSAPETASPTLVPANVTVTQGASRVVLDLDVSVLPGDRTPSHGTGIRPPANVAAGSGGDFCVWRTKAFGDPPPCFKFNIAQCGAPPYATSTKYELVGSDMTKIEASARMSELSRYGGDAYGCLAWDDPDEPDEEHTGHDAGSLRAELECRAGIEITAGARPSRTCGVVVRGWKNNDENVRVAVSHPGGKNLDVWPMEDAAWPPNMVNPGVAPVALKQRYIFTLFLSAPDTATPGLVPVDIIVTQGRSRVDLDLDVSILPPGRAPSRGEGIRPPATVATGSGEYCVWRSKSFGDPPPCFNFNIAECGTAPYATSSKYELVGSAMTKLQASVRMKQLSPYGDDEYGCLAWKPPQETDAPPQTRICADGSEVPEDVPCPEPRSGWRECPDGSRIPVDEACPGGLPADDSHVCPDGNRVGSNESCPSAGTKTCPDGTEVEEQEECPGDPGDAGDRDAGAGSLDCSIYGPQAELYWDAARQENLCRCRPGYEFHASDRCVPVAELGQCLEYPGTYPSGQYCECTLPDHYWSQQLGRCVPAADIPDTELVDCTAYPGSLPEFDAASGEYQCACPSGTQWSDTLNRCATGSEENVAGLDCSSKPGTVPEMDYYLNEAVCRCPGSNETWSDSANACVDGSVAQTPGTQPEPPPPTTVQQGQCNDTARSGSNDPVRVQVEIANVGSLSLSYDTLQKEDRIRAFIDGTLVHDSGCVGTRGDVTQPIQVPPNAQLMEVDVHPNCTGGSGTRWNFVVACDGAGR